MGKQLLLFLNDGIYPGTLGIKKIGDTLLLF